MASYVVPVVAASAGRDRTTLVETSVAID